MYSRCSIPGSARQPGMRRARRSPNWCSHGKANPDPAPWCAVRLAWKAWRELCARGDRVRNKGRACPDNPEQVASLLRQVAAIDYRGCCEATPAQLDAEVEIR